MFLFVSVKIMPVLILYIYIILINKAINRFRINNIEFKFKLYLTRVELGAINKK